ncbi:hypothetical protein F5Y17DRAFT_373137 [Xylariaceae sp. FL0594]|nr:hypothetical protein F5Y17DRAFT_373137 [Xylariaceae sp. FL0594]
MATSREERMQQRMRGAGRHEVGDDSFGFVLPGAEASSDPPSSVPPIRSEPNTSAKRRRLGYAPGSAIATRSITRNDALHLNSTPTAGVMSAHLDNLKLDDQVTPIEAAAHDGAPGGLPDVMDVDEPPVVDEDVQMLSDPIPRGTPPASTRPGHSDQIMMDIMEEVMESPAAAPGSGRRRIVSSTQATHSAMLQRVVMEEDATATEEMPTSSPLARKTKQSRALSTISPVATRASTRRVTSSPIEGIPTSSSPLAHRSRRSTSTNAVDSARSTRSQVRSSNLSMVAYEADEMSSPPDAAGTSSPVKPLRRLMKPPASRASPYDISEDEPEIDDTAVEAEAEAVQSEIEAPKEVDDVGDADGAGGADDVEETGQMDNTINEGETVEAHAVNDSDAARHIGRKRLRISPRLKKPPDDVGSPTADVGDAERTVKKPRSKRKQISPAKQAQPRPTKKKSRLPSRRRSGGDSIPVTVQRYTKPLQRTEADTDEDILNDDMPFTDHKFPNVVDVVLQMCEESIERYLSALHEEAIKADGPANRKMFRTKLRVVEAFQEELRTRLQGQAIALDNLRTLKKRVRAVQKEKISLRNEILRIRTEREQVALKIDAVRNRHETANKETLHQLDLSSAMDDIELAIETGKTAPELSAKEERKAELSNLDLLISQIGNQVSTAGDGGGALKQIREFNMFLERAAAALEGR